MSEPQAEGRPGRITISYSLFGGATDWRNRGVAAYARGVEMVSKAWTLLMPDAEVVVYIHRESVPLPLLKPIERLAELQALRLIDRPPSMGRNGVLWRFEPIWSGATDYVFPRDLDSLPTLDEVANMRFFLQSGKALHLYRARLHWKLWLAGLCGIRAKPMRSRFADPASFWGSRDYTRYGIEEKRLRELAGALQGEIVEAPQSVHLHGSTVPTRRQLQTLRPRLDGYPRVWFAGMRLGEKQIRRLGERLSRVSP